MKIHLSSHDITKLEALFAVKQKNMEAALLLQQFWLLSQSKRIAKLPTNLTKHAYAELIESTLVKGLGAGIDPRFREHYFLPGIHAIDPKQYLNNPYVKTVKPAHRSLGKWALAYERYQPYQGFPFKDVIVLPEKGFQEITPIGFSHQSFEFLTIQEQQTTWMSLTPFEIETMQPVIDQVHGHVLTFGLGLGYFAFMAALKPSVKKVTIIERDTHVISLFRTHLLPQFPYPEKIVIQPMDAIRDLTLIAKQDTYDHLFVDIYHDAVDGLQAYLAIKPQENIFHQTTVHYWLETSILALLRRYVLIYLEEQLHHPDTADYQTIHSVDDAMLQYLHQQWHATTLTTHDALTKILSIEGLKNLLRKPFTFHR
jgi:hypothetical protein